MCSPEVKEVHLKFTHNNVHSQGNHYNPIVHDASIETNLDLLSTVAKYSVKLPTHDVICLESDDEQITTADEPICIDVDTPQKISGAVKSEYVHDVDANTNEIPEIKRGKYFPIYLFDNIQPEEVEYIPGDIDGMRLYRIQATKQNWTRLTRDLHYFTMTSSSKAEYHGKWKIGTCQGSWVCQNTKCCL